MSLFALIPQQVLIGIAASAATALVSLATHFAAEALRKRTKLRHLAAIAEAAGDAVNAAIRIASSTGLPRERIVQLAVDAAKQSVISQFPKIAAALEGELAELDALVHGNVLQKLAPGNVVVNLPNLVPVQGAL